MKKKLFTQELYWKIARHSLWVMRILRAQGRTSAAVSDIAFYLRKHGIHSTPSNLPDFRAVERVLGLKGLRIRKLSNGFYAIPQSIRDFVIDQKRGIYAPDSAEADLDALCSKYEVPELWAKSPEGTASNE